LFKKVLFVLIFFHISLFADSEIHIEKIKKFVNAKFLEKYPKMHINNLEIKRYSKPPKEFKNYKLTEIYIPNGNLKKEKGSVSAIFISGAKKRKLYYHYKLDATVEVLRTNQYIKKGRTLTDDIVDFVTIKFTNFYQVPITSYFLNRYRARTTLVEGKILTTRHISKLTTIKRGDYITATIKDGGVVASFKAQALKDAHIGDIIKIKRDYNNFFQAKIISSTQAEVIW